MTLPSGTTISLNQVNTELSYSSTATIGLNDAAVRTLFGKSSGQISMSDGWGKSNAVTINLTLASNTKNYNIFSNKGGSYVAGKSIINLTINGGVVVGSTSTSTYAMDTGSGWATGDVINITNNGYIAGKGGNGNGGGGTNTDGSPGTAGGSSMNLQWNITTFTNSSGYVYSGGGGGGGGGGGSSSNGYPGAGGAGSTHGIMPGYTANYNGGLTRGAKANGNPGGGGGAFIGNVGTVGTNPGNRGPGAGGGGGGGGGASGGAGGIGRNNNNNGGAGGGHGKAINLNGHTVNGTTSLTRSYGGVS